MVSRLTRTLAIFRLALSFWRDSRRIARICRSEPQTEVQEREDAILAAGAIRFRETALKLGGLIIKVGQFLSARTDLLPLAFTRELTQLQDQVPPAPWDSVRLLMQQEWAREPSEIFDDIEHQPVAAASLGQVHRAHLRDGREVAVKV
ncbi:MAG: AarF/UbiB family protein, partial [Thermaerobacter sp.]|nr:AarF/UbiB family protein [Thermaerobacter sp.]